MADVAVQAPNALSSSSSSRQTIQIVVVDERGSRANCKLYKSERLSEILKKYNTQLHTNYDTIMLNNSPISLSQTPALLGLEDGQTLQFCKIASTQPTSTLNSTTTTSTTSSVKRADPVRTSLSIPLKDDAPSEKQADQRVVALEKELDTIKMQCEVLQNQVVNLENKLSEEQEKTQCRICFEHSRDTVIFPCLHFAYCSVCIEGLKGQNRECPTCRGRIAGTLHIQIG